MSDSTFPEPVARPRVAAGVLFFDEAGRVLLVKPTYKDGWEIPGGYLRPGETPSEAAAREVEEELAIKPPLGPLLVADWAPHAGEGDKLLFVFDGGRLDRAERAAVTPDGVEISAWAYHDRDQLEHLLIPRLARRVLAALDHRGEGGTRYLEHGIPWDR
ncbi:NUDIX domain-containing protein [Streptomyces sp. NPDC049881]|uniref:NUDIX domain-containing protein n=1 Tax=Streptomyces sp. NPDC049881 TaxID=3155778 RepID=UPI003424302B